MQLATEGPEGVLDSVRDGTRNAKERRKREEEQVGRGSLQKGLRADMSWMSPSEKGVRRFGRRLDIRVMRVGHTSSRKAPKRNRSSSWGRKLLFADCPRDAARLERAKKGGRSPVRCGA